MAKKAAQLGVDFIGLHAIWDIKEEELPSFKKMAQELPKEYPHLGIVLVTRQLEICKIAKMAEIIKPSYIQLHALWSANSILNLRKELQKRGLQKVRLIGLVALKDECSPQLISEIKHKVDLLLFDSSPEGGTGSTADITLLKKARILAGSTPVLIAGGLTPENVRYYIDALQPYGVDVQTGIGCPHKCSPERMHAFLEAAKATNRNI